MAREEQGRWMPWPPEGAKIDEIVRWEEGDAACPTPWMVRVTWRFTDDTATPVGVELRGAQGQAVTAEAWRTVRVREVIDETRSINWTFATVGRFLAAHGSEPNPEAATRHAAAARALEPPRKRGRKPTYDDAYYQRVAEVYNAAVAASDRSPVRAVGQALGITDRQDYRPKAAVREARRRGLITERTTGG